jgi:hypothetical protein
MLEILDSLIATIGVVLVLSLIVQAIQQIIKQVWSFKSSYMERELLAMFHPSGSGITEGTAPTTQGLQRFVDNTSRFSIFSTKWIFDVVAPTALKFKVQIFQNNELGELIGAIKEKVAGLGYNDLSLLETMKKEDFQKIVASLPFATEKLETWKKDVENWYDLTLKAFQDHYERKMKAWSYVLSFIVVVCLDANLFAIHKEFSSNKVLRDSAVKMAERLTSIPKDSLIIVTDIEGRNSVTQKIDGMAAQAVERQIAKIDSMVNNNSFQIMRWNTPKGDLMHYKMFLGEPILPSGQDLSVAAGQSLFGWLAMTLLVGLGAPFWYDFLKSVMGIKDVLKSKSQE